MSQKIRSSFCKHGIKQQALVGERGYIATRIFFRAQGNPLFTHYIQGGEKCLVEANPHGIDPLSPPDPVVTECPLQKCLSESAFAPKLVILVWRCLEGTTISRYEGTCTLWRWRHEVSWRGPERFLRRGHVPSTGTATPEGSGTESQRHCKNSKWLGLPSMLAWTKTWSESMRGQESQTVHRIQKTSALGTFHL